MPIVLSEIFLHTSSRTRFGRSSQNEFRLLPSPLRSLTRYAATVAKASAMGVGGIAALWEALRSCKPSRSQFHNHPLRERETESERRVKEWERDWEWDCGILKLSVLLRNFLSGVDEWQVDLNETESFGLGFWACKPSSKNSVSGHINRVLWTRFVSLETESKELDFYTYKPSSMNLVYKPRNWVHWTWFLVYVDTHCHLSCWQTR